MIGRRVPRNATPLNASNVDDQLVNAFSEVVTCGNTDVRLLLRQRVIPFFPGRGTRTSQIQIANEVNVQQPGSGVGVVQEVQGSKPVTVLIILKHRLAQACTTLHRVFCLIIVAFNAFHGA